MNRRAFLAASTPTAPILAGGCTGVANEETGYTYTLELVALESEPTEAVLDYDALGLASSQEQIVAEAAETGAYSEANVNWDSLPGREGITMAFRMVIQLIARHVGRDSSVNRETSFETPSRYDDARYRSVVTVE